MQLVLTAKKPAQETELDGRLLRNLQRGLDAIQPIIDPDRKTPFIQTLSTVGSAADENGILKAQAKLPAIFNINAENANPSFSIGNARFHASADTTSIETGGKPSPAEILTLAVAAKASKAIRENGLKIDISEKSSIEDTDSYERQAILMTIEACRTIGVKVKNEKELLASIRDKYLEDTGSERNADIWMADPARIWAHFTSSDAFKNVTQSSPFLTENTIGAIQDGFNLPIGDMLVANKIITKQEAEDGAELQAMFVAIRNHIVINNLTNNPEKLQAAGIPAHEGNINFMGMLFGSTDPFERAREAIDAFGISESALDKARGIVNSKAGTNASEDAVIKAPAIMPIYEKLYPEKATKGLKRPVLLQQAIIRVLNAFDRIEQARPDAEEIQKRRGDLANLNTQFDSPELITVQGAHKFFLDAEQSLADEKGLPQDYHAKKAYFIFTVLKSAERAVEMFGYENQALALISARVNDTLIKKHSQNAIVSSPKIQSHRLTA